VEQASSAVVEHEESNQRVVTTVSKLSSALVVKYVF
jgi:hypothetical protein